MTTTDRPSPRAIATSYAGYRFRSRLEARWGVFFDSVGRKYNYEQQGYRLSDGTYYLPDFYLPEIKVYVEVKGVMNEEDEHKLLAFAQSRREPVVVLGDVPDPDDHGPHFHIIGKPFGSEVVAVFGAVWALTMRGVRPEQHGIPKYVMPGASFPVDGWDMSSSPVLSAHPVVNEGYRAAKGARFEHGETPRVARVDVATSLGEWFHVPGSDMSHYFVAGGVESLCEKFPIDGHLEKGVDPLAKCWACELYKSHRQRATSAEFAKLGEPGFGRAS